MKTPAIAVVGMACRYPDARSPAELWENVLAARRAFRRLPRQRLRLDDYLPGSVDTGDSISSSEAALIEGYEFDRVRFRVAGSTFRQVDMAHWLALEVAADSLADASFSEGKGLPKEACGVLVGNSLTGEFSRANLMRLRWPYVRRVVDEALRQQDWPADKRADFLEDLEATYKSPFPAVGDETLAGGLSNTIAGRICNHFDLRGGGYTVDGACASSLLAVSTACSALIAEDLDIAIAGGVDLSLDPFELVGFSRLGALAADDMRVYDARSTGFWPGEGCGFVVLMRQEDALREHRNIHALIRGWGISSDGSGGITRPGVEGQLLALGRAYRRAGFGPETVPYFEGHGTGTEVGDAVELQTLSTALSQATAQSPPAVIGTVKANIGHTKAAAGMAGLIKAICAIESQILPPTTGSHEPHPVLVEQSDKLRVLDEGEAWPADRPIRAGVSAMGFGGINAHLVLERTASRRRNMIGPRERALLSTAQDAELLLISGDNAAELGQQVQSLLSYARDLSRCELTDLAVRLAADLRFGTARAALVVSSPAMLDTRLGILDAWIKDGVRSRLDITRGVMLGSVATPPTIGLLMPGQGSTTPLDGGAWTRRFEFVRELYDSAAGCEGRSAAGCEGRRANLPAGSNGVATEVAQPAIVTASLAALHVLDRLNIQAAVAVGHSLGELTAYHWGGALSEETLLRMATARGRAIADFGRPGGAMASIAAGREAVEPLLDGQPVVIAGLNSPGQTVVSGEAAAVKALVAKATAMGITAVGLSVSHAFHSPYVADCTAPLARAIAGEDFRALERPVASTITGRLIQPEDDLRELLLRQMTSPVRMIDAMAAVSDKMDLWIEAGPGSVLSRLAKQLVEAPTVSLDAGGSSLGGLLRAAGAAFVLGVNLDHRELFATRFSRPFQLDWRPSFFANPCEKAPDLETVPTKKRPVSQAKASDDPPAETMSVPADATPLEVVRQLAAQRAELPLSAIGESDRLLSDLHLSSLAVGQLVVEAARALHRPPPNSPTDAADATIAQLAEALAETAEIGSEASGEAEDRFPPGVDSWVRAFVDELVPRDLPKHRVVLGDGDWQIIAPANHPLADALRRELADNQTGSGVIVCLPGEPDQRHVAMLLRGARDIVSQPDNRRFVLIQHGGGAAAFARSLYLEYPAVTTCVVDVPWGDSRAVEWIVDEIRAAVSYTEAHYDANGTRRVPVLRLLPLPNETPPVPLDADDVMLVTGGGKGIAAECAFSLAKQAGVRLALLGRSQPEHDELLAANLRRMEAAGILFRYLVADVTDQQAVRDSVRRIETELGPVTALLHGAGVNVPRPLAAIDEDAFLATLGPKLQGARNVLDTLDAAQLRLLVTFSSIIARTGMRGQADYAVANEWLTRLTQQWQEQHPHCHCVAMEWSVWSGVGMGERLGAVEALRAQGISPIGPDEGVRMLQRLIGQQEEGSGLFCRHGPAGASHKRVLTPFPVAIIVAGRFGDPPTVQTERPELPLLRFLQQPRVHVPDVELIVEAELSTDTDPYLKDHVYQDMPLLPGVVGLEAMAQVAMALNGGPTLPVFENVEFLRPIVVPDGQRTTIRVAALRPSQPAAPLKQPGRIDVVIRSEETAFQADHFRATCLMQPDGPAMDESPSLLIGKGVRTVLCEAPSGPCRQKSPDPFSYTRLPIRPVEDLYEQILFHRGRFRRVEAYYRLCATECVAQIAAPEADDWFSSYLPAELVLGDAAARDAVIHAVQACIPHGTLLPLGVDRLVIHAHDTFPVRVHARERSQDGDTYCYDIEVIGPDGRVCERWDGLRLRRVGRVAPSAAWAEPLLGPYIERRLGELIPGCSVAAHLHREATVSRRVRSDRAIEHLLRTPVAIHRRPDGKPEVGCEEDVSVSHAEDLTMVVAADMPVACDIEALTARPADAWRDVLGSQRTALAELVADRLNESCGDSSTRVWTALECLKKTQTMSEAPLVFHAATDDHWVLFKSGNSIVASWITSLRGGDRIALAVLTGESHAGV